MDREQMESRLEGIRHLLSHLHGEVTALGTTYDQLLSVLRTVQDQSMRDDLTGLMRRNAFFATWNALIAECAQLQEQTGVILVDIDHFKKINDTQGHDVGDQVITRVAQILKRFETPQSAAGRLGGEEFALAVRVRDASTQVPALAEQIRVAVEREAGCTISVGVAFAGQDPHVLLKRADAALYSSKQTGRNRVSRAA